MLSRCRYKGHETSVLLTRLDILTCSVASLVDLDCFSRIGLTCIDSFMVGVGDGFLLVQCLTSHSFLVYNNNTTGCIYLSFDACKIYPRYHLFQKKD